MLHLYNTKHLHAGLEEVQLECQQLEEESGKLQSELEVLKKVRSQRLMLPANLSNHTHIHPHTLPRRLSSPPDSPAAIPRAADDCHLVVYIVKRDEDCG